MKMELYLGEYYADLLVEEVLIIEVKAGRSLALEHEAQVLGYLRSAKLEHGLLINFGSSKFEIRKFAWSQFTKRTTALERADERSRFDFTYFANFAFFAAVPFLLEVIHSRAVVPEPFAFHLFGEGLLQEGVDGVGVFYV